MGIVLSAVWFIVVILVLVDIITRDQSRIRHLDKTMWLIIVIILPLIGTILWFAIGRERDASPSFGSFSSPVRAEPPQRQSTRSIALSTEDELAAVEREIAFHENQARIRRLEAQLEARRSGESTS